MCVVCYGCGLDNGLDCDDDFFDLCIGFYVVVCVYDVVECECVIDLWF